MPLARLGRIVFGLGAMGVGAVALADILLHGRVTALSPLILAAIALVGLAFLLLGLLDARGREEGLRARTGELGAVTAKLEESLAAMSAMNARLHESETRYKGLVDAQGDPIFRRAPDSRLTYGNDAFFKLFGLNPREAVGRPFAPELHRGSRAPHFDSFSGRAPGKLRARYDQYIRTAYGWRWIAWEDHAIRNAAGQLIEIQSVGRDVTERKALEDALTEARDKAEAASRAKSGFLATMSHEIRTPMNGVLGMARLLIETRLHPEQRTYADAIVQSGESLLALIEDILDFSKIEAGTMTLEDDEIDVQQILGGVVELAAPRGHAKNIEVIALVAPEVPEAIRVDGVRLRQVLTNLVGNAVKFTEKGGVRVIVRLEKARDRNFLRFEVQDTGVGVPEEKRQEIFKEFVQADSTHARRFGGSGLGLAICKRLVAAMGGEIGVDAASGGGSNFWFTIPSVVVRPAPKNPRERLAGRRVAIVTRNAVLREGLTQQLRYAGGRAAPLGSSESGQEGVYDLDALLIDAGTGEVPELPASPDARIPSIVLVTPSARTHLGDLKARGFAGYLVKPVRQASLIDRILAGAAQTIEMPEPAAEMSDPERQSAPPSSEPDEPAPEQPPMAEQQPGALPPRTPQSGPNGVLLAEDNPINAMLTRELLRRRGYEVTVVECGEDAVAALEEGCFDLVLTDIHMPGLDGVEATRRIRANEARHGRGRTPIVALTADALETGKRACQDAGMDGFLTKPVNPSELDAMLADLFQTGDSAIQRDAAA